MNKESRVINFRKLVRKNHKHEIGFRLNIRKTGEDFQTYNWKISSITIFSRIEIFGRKLGEKDMKS
jgi:hypothetical protein